MSSEEPDYTVSSLEEAADILTEHREQIISRREGIDSAFSRIERSRVVEMDDISDGIGLAVLTNPEVSHEEALRIKNAVLVSIINYQHEGVRYLAERDGELAELIASLSIRYYEDLAAILSKHRIGEHYWSNISSDVVESRNDDKTLRHTLTVADDEKFEWEASIDSNLILIHHLIQEQIRLMRGAEPGQVTLQDERVDQLQESYEQLHQILSREIEKSDRINDE